MAALTPTTRKLVRQLLAHPDCVRCGSKCYQWTDRDSGELVQKCFWCSTAGRAVVTQHGPWTVRTWAREVML